MKGQEIPPEKPSLLAAMDAQQQHAAAIERAVYRLWRPLLMPLRRLSGYVSRDRRRRDSAG